MLDQLQKIAREHLEGTTYAIAEMEDLEGKQVNHETAEIIVNTIIQQAKKGNAGALREMLSGTYTDNHHDIIDQLLIPVTGQLQNKLNISVESSRHIAQVGIPVILNMMNDYVKKAHASGVDLQSMLNSMNSYLGPLGGIINFISGNKNGKMINQMLGDLIK